MDREKEELARLIAESITAVETAKPADWWSLLDSWGPAIAVPVMTLAAFLIGAWRATPKILAWFDAREKHKEDREDEIREAYFDSLREVTQNVRCAFESRDEPPVYADTGTARMRQKIRQ